MGITGLLSVLKSIQKHTHLRQFAGQTIGVDAYGWLHRGTVGCALELALDRPTKKYVEFAVQRVRMLMYFGVTPYLVFDGDNLPGKVSTEDGRARKREESRKRGLELYNARKVSQAYPEFQKAVDVTPYMARQLIEELKKMNIQYVVAPYEADAQLAYLEQKGIINGILSEDSDLLVYGAKRLITKLDAHGDCIEISRSDFASCKDMTLAGFTDADFRTMAILSGCDYLASISKIGLKTAHTYVRKYKNVEKILRMLQFEQKFVIPDGYLELYYDAERTFLHHRVFCPLQRKLVFLSEPGLELKVENMSYLGENVSPETAIGVACGDLDPMTKKPILANFASSLSRSMPDLHRRPPLASAHDLKPSKSIDNFFKPKRQPLAELDPNSLTPSPSQQRLLRIHSNASWEARPVSSAPQPRRSRTFLPSPGQTRSADRSAFLERAATLSTFQPIKRTRLCSDIDVSPSGKDNASPFFAPKPAPSPSLQKKGRTKKARRSDIEIFSDDSVAEIFQGMQESEKNPVESPITPALQSGGTMQNGEAGGSISETSVTAVFDTPVRQRAQNSGYAASRSTLVVSVSETDHPDDFQDLLDIHVDKLNDLRKTFTYQSPERQVAALSKLESRNTSPQDPEQEATGGRDRSVCEVNTTASPTASAQKGSQRTSALHMTFGNQSLSQQAAAMKSLDQPQSSTHMVKIGLAAAGSYSKVTSHHRLMTPLERLGQRALSGSSTHDGGVFSSSLSARVTSCNFGGNSPTDNTAGVHFQGSEDCIVPNSEDETSELSDEDSAEEQRPRLDLGRFAFTTK